MTISDRKLRSLYRRKVDPVLESINGWADVDNGSDISSWVPAHRPAATVAPREAASLGDDLADQWRGTRRESLAPLAKTVGDLVGKVDAPGRDEGRELSATVYEMH